MYLKYENSYLLSFENYPIYPSKRGGILILWTPKSISSCIYNEKVSWLFPKLMPNTVLLSFFLSFKVPFLMHSIKGIWSMTVINCTYQANKLGLEGAGSSGGTIFASFFTLTNSMKNQDSIFLTQGNKGC